MTTEVRLFSPVGIPLADVNVVPTASHIISDVGDCSFEMSLENAAANETNLRFGNIILINDDLLPSWVGFIEPELGREWGAGKITIRALSAESIFSDRIVYPQQLRGTVGAIMRAMLNEMLTSSEGGIKLLPGDIYMTGRESIYPNLGRARDVMDRIAKKGKCDWSVTHQIVNGKLELYANLYEGERGRVTGKILSAHNTELFEPIYREEGKIWNHVVFMRPLAEGQSVKVSRVWRDEESIGLFGLKQYLGEANAEDDEVLDWQARAWLYDHAYPRGITEPNIINVDNIFNDIDLGNKYRWENHAAQFNGGLIGTGDEVRLTGYEADYGNAKVAAVIESTKKPFDISELFRE